MSDVEIVEAGVEDIGEVLILQRAAYVSEALLYGDPDIPPLTQTLDELRAELAECLTLKAIAGGRVVGSVRARVDGRTGHIGRLIVAPDLQGRGLGTRLLAEIEERLVGRVDRFELFTGDRSEANLRLYRRFGYHETRRESLHGALELVHMEKPAPRPMAPR